MPDMAYFDDNPSEKPVLWIGSSREDLRAFPDEVKREFGNALWLAQIGEEHPDATPMRGYRGRSVLEVVEDYDDDTYRAVYTIRFQEAVYVLHAFQKKSKQGIKTPLKETRLIDARLRQAEAMHQEWLRTRLRQPDPSEGGERTEKRRKGGGERKR